MHAACMVTGKWLHPQHKLRAVKACNLQTLLEAGGRLSLNAGKCLISSLRNLKLSVEFFDENLTQKFSAKCFVLVVLVLLIKKLITCFEKYSQWVSSSPWIVFVFKYVQFVEPFKNKRHTDLTFYRYLTVQCIDVCNVMFEVLAVLTVSNAKRLIMEFGRWQNVCQHVSVYFPPSLTL